MRPWSKGEEPLDMKDLGKGLGTCGIWLGVGMIGWQDPGFGAAASVMAGFATIMLWISHPST